MFDLSSKNSGASIVLATSNDQNYPPENMMDGKDDTFWTTTGLFPQEFVMSFGHLMSLQRISITCYNVRKLVIEKNTSGDPNNYENVTEMDMPQTDGQWQNEEFDLKPSIEAVQLRFRFESAFDHFICVHKLNIDGNAVRGA